MTPTSTVNPLIINTILIVIYIKVINVHYIGNQILPKAYRKI